MPCPVHDAKPSCAVGSWREFMERGCKSAPAKALDPHDCYPDGACPPNAKWLSIWRQAPLPRRSASRGFDAAATHPAVAQEHRHVTELGFNCALMNCDAGSARKTFAARARTSPGRAPPTNAAIAAASSCSPPRPPSLPRTRVMRPRLARVMRPEPATSTTHAERPPMSSKSLPLTAMKPTAEPTTADVAQGGEAWPAARGSEASGPTQAPLRSIGLPPWPEAQGQTSPRNRTSRQGRHSSCLL
eukprot:scaffold52681_cov69-Phaeocystis_antarctica.AAC.8